MLTLQRYWSSVQKQLNEKECFTPDQFEFWLYAYKYAKEFLALREQCFNRLHTFPGSDEIAISYMDMGNTLGVAFLTQRLIIINPFHLLAIPEFTIKYIIPHEYVHIMLEDIDVAHGPKFYQYFEAVVGEKHPNIDDVATRKECKYHLEVMRGVHYVIKES